MELGGNKQELALVRSKQVLALGNILELALVCNKLALALVRSKLVQVLRSKLGLVRSNRSLLCGIRTSLLH